MLVILLLAAIAIGAIGFLKKKGKYPERITLQKYCEIECTQNITSKYRFCC